MKAGRTLGKQHQGDNKKGSSGQNRQDRADCPKSEKKPSQENKQVGVEEIFHGQMITAIGSSAIRLFAAGQSMYLEISVTAY